MMAGVCREAGLPSSYADLLNKRTHCVFLKEIDLVSRGIEEYIRRNEHICDKTVVGLVSGLRRVLKSLNSKRKKIQKKLCWFAVNGTDTECTKCKLCQQQFNSSFHLGEHILKVHQYKVSELMKDGDEDVQFRKWYQEVVPAKMSRYSFASSSAGSVCSDVIPEPHNKVHVTKSAVVESEVAEPEHVEPATITGSVNEFEDDFITNLLSELEPSNKYVNCTSEVDKELSDTLSILAGGMDGLIPEQPAPLSTINIDDIRPSSSTTIQSTSRLKREKRKDTSPAKKQPRTDKMILPESPPPSSKATDDESKHHPPARSPNSIRSDTPESPPSIDRGPPIHEQDPTPPPSTTTGSLPRSPQRQASPPPPSPPQRQASLPPPSPPRREASPSPSESYSVVSSTSREEDQRSAAPSPRAERAPSESSSSSSSSEDDEPPPPPSIPPPLKRPTKRTRPSSSSSVQKEKKVKTDTQKASVSKSKASKSAAKKPKIVTNNEQPTKKRSPPKNPEYKLTRSKIYNLDIEAQLIKLKLTAGFELAKKLSSEAFVPPAERVPKKGKRNTNKKPPGIIAPKYKRKVSIPKGSKPPTWRDVFQDVTGGKGVKTSPYSGYQMMKNFITQVELCVKREDNSCVMSGDRLFELFKDEIPTVDTYHSNDGEDVIFPKIFLQIFVNSFLCKLACAMFIQATSRKALKCSEQDLSTTLALDQSMYGQESQLDPSVMTASKWTHVPSPKEIYSLIFFAQWLMIDTPPTSTSAAVDMLDDENPVMHRLLNFTVLYPGLHALRSVMFRVLKGIIAHVRVLNSKESWLSWIKSEKSNVIYPLAHLVQDVANFALVVTEHCLDQDLDVGNLIGEVLERAVRSPYSICNDLDDFINKISRN